MIEVIPAIIPQSFEDLEDKLSRIVGVVPMVQIDVLDGKLSERASWPYQTANDPEFAGIIAEEEGMPYWEDIEFEADLMVTHPEEFSQAWVSAGASRIIVHRSSFVDTAATIRFLSSFAENFGRKDSIVRAELGLALEIDSDPAEVAQYIEYLDCVQCMGIAEIGKQGEPFDERVLRTIRSLREAFPELIISVDGGVTFESAPKLIEAGANRLVAGSLVFGSDDPHEVIAELESLE